MKTKNCGTQYLTTAYFRSNRHQTLHWYTSTISTTN